MKEHSYPEYILENKNHSKPTGGVFLDISKAFDKVLHDGLIYKLIKLKVPHYFAFLIKSYLSNRKFFSNSADSISSNKNVTAEVP